MAERLELLIPEERIRAEVAALARQIDADCRDKRLSLVVVLKGAFVFAADLMRQIATPFTLHFVSAASYGAGSRSSGQVALSGLDGLDLAGCDVLVIEDILDTGRTVGALLKGLQRHQPAKVKICALLRKPGAFGLDLPAVHIGFDIPDDFVVGYGMDYAERYRNLPGIHRLIFDRGR